MSDVSPLTPAQIDELKEDLIALEAALAAHLSQVGDSAKTVDLDTPIGRLSRIDAMAQQQVAKAGKAAAQRRLGQARAALRRMEEGSYGICVRTDEPIGYERLKIRPETPLSLAGQQELESAPT